MSKIFNFNGVLQTNGNNVATSSEVSGMVLVFSNVSVATSSFVADSTYESYPYKANITCSGVTSDYVPTVNFDTEEAISGKFAPIADASANTVTIYASEIPSNAITISSIMCIKGVS